MHHHSNAFSFQLLCISGFFLSWLLNFVFATDIYIVGQKISNLFLSKLCEISTKFDNFLRTDSQDGRIMQRAVSFHLT